MMKSETEDLDEIFTLLEGLLRAYSKGLVLRDSTIDSKAKVKKRSLHLYGAKEVAIGNRKPQPTYIAGIIKQKHFVGFYSMPVYSHPAEVKIASMEIGGFLKGKSCFNVRRLTPEIMKEFDQHLKEGIRIYKKEGWI